MAADLTRDRGNAEVLRRYWTRGKGLAKWADNPHPWQTLYNHLIKYVPPHIASGLTSNYFHDVFHIWPGERNGVNPLGPG